ncbi:MAG TPA: MlaD family protein [bacterium]|nr:MlaD family protein [bacterium]
MQITPAQKRRVALFFLFGIGLFVLVVGVIVGDQLLKREDCYYSKFQDVSVAGLSEGSSVKFQGMNIGSVQAISIDEADTTIIRIDFCLKPGTPMKEGTTSQLGNIGITGLKFLELKGGGKFKDIPKNGEVPSIESQWDQITGKAEVITEKLEIILNNVNNVVKEVKPETVKQIANNIAGISESLNTILAQNKDNVRSLTGESAQFMKKLNQSMTQIDDVVTDIRAMTAKDGILTGTLTSFSGTSEELGKTVREADLKGAVEKITLLLDSLQKTTETVNLTLIRSQEDINQSLMNLSESMYNFNEFTRIIMENPGAILQGAKSEEEK